MRIISALVTKQEKKFMKKAKPTNEMRPEYNRNDLAEGVRGKYYSAFK